ncbi:MAG: type II toxin-antitoxin system RelE/ParE family toxin [Cyanobacteria bacterium P01_F01_bin.143]
MASYEVFVAEQYDKQLEKMGKSDRVFIEKKMKEYVIPQLKSEPYFGSNIKKLKNYDPPTWRYRIGKYRIFYEIDSESQEVNILSIHQRKDAY